MQAGLPRIGLRVRLFLISVLLIALVGSASAILLRASLRGLLERRITSELGFRADTVRILVESLDPGAEVEQVDRIVSAFALEANSPRITVITAEGTVLADSRLDDAAVALLGDLSARPEVREVLAGAETSTQTRLSETLGQPMLFVAVPYRTSTHSGVVRASVEVEVMEEALAPFNLAVGAAGVAGLGIAVFMSGLASHLASRDLRLMMERVQRALARSREGGSQAQEEQDLSVLAGGVQDLAERWRQANSDAHSERARLSALLDSLKEGVLALDPDGHITGANPAALRLLNLQGPPLGRSLVDVVRAAPIITIVRAALHEGSDGSAEVELNEGLFVLATARPLQGQAGCVLVLHDLSGMRRLERVRRDFVANVSHELRTPVTIIRTNAESLADGAMEEPAVAKVFLTAILRNTERLGQLINDLLDLSRIESGRQVMRSQRVELAPLVDRVLENLLPRAAECSSSLQSQVDAGAALWGDATAVEQILMNLLENAVSYAGPGSTIRVHATARGSSLRVVVEDDGPGIAERHRERVFERFYRVDPGRARQHGGTGLGLAIVKNLAEAMQGSVGLEAARPKGCRFWFELPQTG